MHYKAIVYLRSGIMPERSANTFIDEYELGLKLDTGAGFDRLRVFDAYSATVKPLISLAKRSGFKGGWIYS